MRDPASSEGTKPTFALILGGGNALGAYHAGLYQALFEAEIEPDWIIGTSIGAVTGAVIAGNPPADRLERLHRLWRPAEDGRRPMPWDMISEPWRRTGAVIETLLGGRRGLFGPLGSGLLGPGHDGGAGTPALYGSHALADTLRELVDFDLLNQGPVRLTAACVDIESGEEVWADTRKTRVTPDHIRASAALLSTFPAVEVDGRLLGDGGLSANLPLDPIMSWSDGAPLLCIAADLLPLASKRPRTLGEVVARTQGLMFAAQTRRTLDHWKARFAVSPDGPDMPSITLAMLTYEEQDQEVAGKAMDFSPWSVRDRWNAGHHGGVQAIAQLKQATTDLARPGLTVVPCGGSGPT